MKFLSINEFFYKLNTIGFILLLLPLVTFIFLFLRTEHGPFYFTEPDGVKGLVIGASVIFLAILTIVHLRKKTKVRELKSLIELSRKMDGYGEIFFFRMYLYSFTSFLSVLGFFLTGSSYFTSLLLLIVVVSAGQWPFRSSFCKLLELNRNETEMVLKGSDVVDKKKKRA
jgi:hypothetical protein